MALAAADFTRPEGELRLEWFPGDDLEATCTAWLGQLPEGASDELAEAYVYKRAYQDIASRIHHEFASADVEGKGGVQRTAIQMQYFQARAAHWADMYETLAGEEVAPTGGALSSTLSRY